MKKYDTIYITDESLSDYARQFALNEFGLKSIGPRIVLTIEELREVFNKGYVRGCEEAEAKSHGDYSPCSAPNFSEYLTSKNIQI